MVIKAGISKGLLFHYFENKKNIYLYLVDYSMKHFLDRFYDNDFKTSSDLFDGFL